MRVLVLGWNSLLDEGNFGVRAIRTYCDWLTEAGHEVTVLTSAHAPGSPGYSLPDLIKKQGVVGGGRFLPQSLMVAMFAIGRWRAQVLCTAVNGIITAVDRRAYESHVQRILRDVRPHLTIAFDLSETMQGSLRLVRQAGCPVLALVDSVRYEQKSLFQHASRVLCLSPELPAHYSSHFGMRSAGFPAPSGTAPGVTSSNEIVILDPDNDGFFLDLAARLEPFSTVQVCAGQSNPTGVYPTGEVPLEAGLGILLQGPDISQTWLESFSRAGVPLLMAEEVVREQVPNSREEWIEAWARSALNLIQKSSEREQLILAQAEIVQKLYDPMMQIPAYIRIAESMVQPGATNKVTG